MKEAGITVFEPGSDGGVSIPSEAPESDEAPPTQEEFEAAEAACEAILDDAFGDFELTPEQEAVEADFQLALETCLADAGVDVEFEENGAVVFDATDDAEEVNAEFERCASEASEAAGFAE